MSVFQQNSTRTYKGKPNATNRLILLSLSEMAKIEAKKRHEPRLKRLVRDLKKLLYPSPKYVVDVESTPTKRPKKSTPFPGDFSNDLKRTRRISSKPSPKLVRAGSAGNRPAPAPPRDREMVRWEWPTRTRSAEAPKRRKGTPI